MATLPSNPHYLVILCGGTGPRLWPMSRVSFPKPFLQIFDKLTLLQHTYARAIKIVPAKNIFIVTNKKYIKLVNQQIPHANIISEPSRKNTARAILTATKKIFQLSPHAIISTLPSDHFIKDTFSFKKDLHQCYLQSLSGSISLLGIKPTSPDISYGYLSTDGVSKVKGFLEKPDLDIARHLTYQPHTYWNSGIYTFLTTTLLSEFEKYQPLYLKTDYAESLELSIDVAISQRSSNLSFVPASFDWSDIGEWKTIFDQLPKDSNKISVLNKSEYISVNSSNCLLSTRNSKLIGLVGVKDLAIIDTPDGLLICSLKNDDSYQVKELVHLIVSHQAKKRFFLKKHD